MTHLHDTPPPTAEQLMVPDIYAASFGLFTFGGFFIPGALRTARQHAATQPSSPATSR